MKNIKDNDHLLYEPEYNIPCTGNLLKDMSYVCVFEISYQFMNTGSMLKTDPSSPLSPQQGASSGCGWRDRPTDMEGSCKYIE
jgi:hypothetical protein